MQQEGLVPSHAYSKCAGVVGEVLKRYHPHGIDAVYDALVRMAQDFSLRYPLVDGQGNFGSIDGDPPAAYRYTECRLLSLAEEMLRGIDRDTVDFVPNYDGNLSEPTVLPTRIPQLLANGSAGIAVGMATNIPPHNLRELVAALLLEARNPACNLADLMELLPGPDFPTGALICGSAGIRSAYATGRGLITVRGRATIEEQRRGSRIVVTEIPFMVNKTTLLKRMAEQVHAGRISGVADSRDESNREGLRVVVELKRDANAEVTLNQLYKQTPLQTTFGINLLALVNGRPQTLSLKAMLRHFLDFRREVVIRTAIYDLRQAEQRVHVLEGFAAVLENLDAAIAVIRAAADAAAARAGLIERFRITEQQANAVLGMRLRALTALERQRVLDELAERRAEVEELRGLLASEARILDTVIAELEEVAERYGDARRTEIALPVESIETEDLIPEENMAVTVSHLGYVKRNPLTQYRAQHRGGKGLRGMDTRDQDFVEQLFVASTHAYVLFFTNRGRAHWKKVWELPQLGRAAKGRSLANLLSLSEGERVCAVLPVRSFADEGEGYVVLCTRRGVIKKTRLDAFASPRRGGIIAIQLEGDDEVMAAARAPGDREILLVTRDGSSVRFAESEVRPTGRAAIGVRGIALAPRDQVVGMEILSPRATILTVTERGYGKRTPLDDYRVQRRGGRGVIAIRTGERNGAVIGVTQVHTEDQVMVVTDGGQVLRCKVSGIPTMGRATQGVRVMDLAGGERLVALARMAEGEGA